MQFWRIDEPDYGSDYQHSYVNGSLEHPYGMPGVHCDACGSTWGGIRSLPIALPDSLQRRKNLKKRWPISLKAHRALGSEVQEALRRCGVEATALEPGDRFQPCYLDIPSRPRADFLWCSLGSVVVSERPRELFKSLRLTGAAFSPVVLRKVGKREARLPAPRPSTGEPEDIIKEVPLLSRTETVGPYFELCVQATSGYAPRAHPLEVCSGCGRETFPDDDKSRLVMVESMWKGADVFFLASTLYVVVTDRVRQALMDLQVTNVRFRSFESA
jgi:hypothetical protein